MKQIEREPQSLRGRVLALLLLAYIFNFLDRNVAGVLAVPIRAEFHLSDTALSELGIAFGLFYATVAIPIARLADRRSRANIIAISVAVWSLFSAACGLVGSGHHDTALGGLGRTLDELGHGPEAGRVGQTPHLVCGVVQPVTGDGERAPGHSWHVLPELVAEHHHASRS